MADIKLENVNFSYKGSENPTLNDINLEVAKGEVLVLCGESGCGKSTVIRLINGLIPFYYSGDSSGKVSVLNSSVKDGTIYDAGTKVSTVFQNPRSQFYCVEVRSELAFGAENLNIPREKIENRIAEVSHELDFENLLDRTMFQLSGGEKQKIACASVSVTDNPIVVLDEPSSNLDMYAVSELKKMICLWKNQGKTIVIAEHRLNYLQDIADRFVFMKCGRIEADFTAEEFRKISTATLNSMGLRSIIYDDLHIENKRKSKDFIKIRDLLFKYRGTKNPSLLIDSLKLPKGAVIAVTGRNGAGKSTFVRNFCGLERRGKGILTDGEKRLNRRKRLNSSFLVMQDVNHQLFTESVVDEITLSMAKPDEKSIDYILKSFDLEEFKDRHPMSLSGGQKQRVAVASAIASARDYIAFDEPTSGLDFLHMKQVAECIMNLQNSGKTIFLITHDLELIYSCCNFVLRIEDGKAEDVYELNEENSAMLNQFFRI